MSFVAAEIATQPDLWVRATTLAAEPAVAAALPGRGARVAVVGCGTSLYMARAWAARREELGYGETDAFPASEFPAARRYDRVVALTRSGTTTEIVRLVSALRGVTPTTVITADASLPAGAAADSVVELAFADEKSVVQTRFATTALALLRSAVGDPLDRAVADVRAELARPVPAGYRDRRQFTFLGTGWTVGLAEEAGLKLRESAQAWAEAYPAMEYRHGPISVADEHALVWVFGAAPEGLRAEIEQTAATVITSAADPMAELVGAQRLAVELAERRGLDPDAPRNLTRSIVLTDS
ncbi:MAG: SIS domain-containing protein [Jatrophihabitans sp.]|uniref:SIS domain-containing protein n=1 Tax=Jatrophihabitans sp. TaxID=1932789 RepID=UPI0039127B1C